MLHVVRHRKITFSLSAALFLISVVLLGTLGLKPGIDFTGGSLFEISFSETRPTVDEMHMALDQLDFVGSVLVQPAGEDSMQLKTQFLSEDQHQALLQALRDNFETESNRVLEERADVIGPAVSSNLRSKSFYAAFTVIIAIILYVAYAFRKVSAPVQSWKYGLAAIVALIHDVTITMAAFALLGYYLGVEVDIPFVVALLTILGYSVNDTIVVFDRVRENLLQDGSGKFEESVNNGVNETFVRSLNTSMTTLVVLAALFFFGGASIQYFALALMIGITLGTYSSIFLASPLLVEWKHLSDRKRSKA